ncbi:hypothetical protein D9757_002157 [Collybiopsis confluens]|uniref:Uncharacterized protein n=1 Tax=Collybiopsis confluens TaxID=2823264 RepID=A0A8H5I001_9AGAR|nr:hypothetical protein D9757_002157 [Collybiopsis confluens]
MLGPALRSLHIYTEFSALTSLLSTLSSMRTLSRYCHSPTEFEWALETVLDSLTSQGLRQNIGEFRFHYALSWMNIFDSLRNLPHLESLSLRNIPYGAIRDILTAIPPIISRPSSKKLHLILQDYYAYVALRNYIPKHITHLGLSGFSIHEPSQVIHYNLVFLEIHLHNLVITRTDEAVDTLLDYLRSYSGLQVPLGGSPLDLLTMTLVKDSSYRSIQRHLKCRNLQSLSVKSNYGGDVYFGPSSQDEAFQMPALSESVHLLLDMVSSSLLELEKLSVESDMIVGAEYYLLVRKGLQASLEECVTRDTARANVLKFLKVYIGREKSNRRARK